MIPTIIISVITFISIIASIIFFPYIKIGRIRIGTYWVIALVGAILLLSFSFAPIDEVFKQLTNNNSVNPIKILVLFFSMTLISVFLDEFGLFKFLASKASKHAKGNQYSLFFILFALTSLLTIFTSNDVVILTLTPFICFFCKRSKINPTPYLVMEFAAANTWSLMFIIGNPTNIYLATNAGITFIDYFKVMAIPTLCAGLIELSVLFLMFRRWLKQPIYICEEEYHISNKPLLIIGISHLFVCLIFLTISSYLNIEMWFVSMICGLSLFIATLIMCVIKKDQWYYILDTIKRLPYALIPFFLSMTIIVIALNYQGISKEIASFLGNRHPIWVYGFSSFLTSNVINNIPMSVLFSNLISTLEGKESIVATYASIIGSNIGAFLTPIGALAGIMFSNLIHEQGIRFTFLDFIKYEALISIPVIAISLLMTGVMLQSF